jgi:hypothetical protein
MLAAPPVWGHKMTTQARGNRVEDYDGDSLASKRSRREGTNG